MAGFHLFPFRTEKLSPPAPMVLHTRGRVGSRRFSMKEPDRQNVCRASFVEKTLSNRLYTPAFPAISATRNIQIAQSVRNDVSPLRGS